MTNSTLTGIVRGLSNEAYHANPALGSTGLKRLNRSPMHFRYAPSIARTPAMKLGTLAHTALLEPGTLAERYVIRPDSVDMRTKAGKDWAASVPADVDVVTMPEFMAAQTQADAVRALPELAEILADGEAEVSAFWVDAETGVACKCRPDWVHTLPDGRVVLVDLKTTKDASPDGFSKQMANLGYHIQAAHYSTGWTAATGQEVAAFIFAAVENEPPYAAMAYRLGDVSKFEGLAECRRLIDLYAECKAANRWPGYGDAVQTIDVPDWALNKTEVEISYA